MSDLTTNGVNVYYDVQGRGIPIIFIHPPVLSSACFCEQVDGLSPIFQTIRFDIRGHGRSQPSHESLTYTLIAGDIKNLMDHLQIDKAYLCGYSTGGSIALEFLLTYPERAFGAIVVGGMSEVHDLRLASLIIMGMIITKIGASVPLALELAWSQANGLKQLRRMYHEAKLGNAENMAQYYRCSLTYNCTSRLKQIHSPVLIVCGAKDKGFYSYTRLLRDTLPINELEIVKSAHHQIPTKNAYDLNERITRFIEGHEPIMW